MKNQNLINSQVFKDAKTLCEANQLSYVIYSNVNSDTIDYCSLPEWNLVFEHIPNFVRIKTVTPAEKTDYNNVVISAQLMLNRHSDLFKDFEIIEFKENQYTYKLIRK